jgi:ferredoxin
MNKCENNGLCAMSAYEVFKLSADGSLEVLDENPSDLLRSSVEQAVNYCPTGAISIS